MSEDDPLVGTLVAERYRVGRKLGVGGMGVVYLAVHEALHKQVALKILKPTGKVDREAIGRFEREAIAAANLKHPNIAEATDFGQLPGGGLYLVMEYVEGPTLKQLLAEQGKLAPDRALAILQQIGSALATAHARDVVHRDLKPDNVIVTSVPGSSTSPAADVVKVVDFGIAKLRSATFGGGGTGLTSVGSVFGTPEYMSPEQVMGQPADGRADQYALGVLAFELLTGKPPFKADDVGRLMMMHVGAPVPSTREQTPALPPDIDVVTSRMLAKLPDERFDSVAEALRALAAALTAPSSASPVGLAPPPPAFGAASHTGGAHAPPLSAPSSASHRGAVAPPPPSAPRSSFGGTPHASPPSAPSATSYGGAAQGSGGNTLRLAPWAGSGLETTQPSPRFSAMVPGATTGGWLVIAIGAGVVSLLVGVVFLALVVRSCAGPTVSPAEVEPEPPNARAEPAAAEPDRKDEGKGKSKGKGKR